MTIIDDVEDNPYLQGAGASSTSPSSLSFHGSYKMSLLSRRMHAVTSAPLPFTLMVSILDLLPYNSLSFCPPTKLRLAFSASYYELHGPWVADIDLLHKPDSVHVPEANPQAIAVSRRGQLQLLIQNQQETLIRCLVVPYDMSHLLLGQCTYFRKLWYVGQNSAIRYGVHLQFVCTKPLGEINPPKDDTRDDMIFDMEPDASTTVGPAENESVVYLHRDIKLIFAPRAPDPDESLRIEVEGAKESFPWTHWHRPASSLPSPAKKRHSRSSSLSNILAGTLTSDSGDLVQ